METLQGNFLLATAQMPDPRFQKQIVYLCSHSLEDGAIGLIINHPLPHNLAEIMEGAGIDAPETPLPSIYFGGPVEMDAGFFLYSSDFTTDHFIQVTESVHLSRDVEILRSIAHGTMPENYLFALGYAGWGPGQLESELTDNGWLVLPGDDEIIFNTADEEKWGLAARNAGIDINIFDDVAGSA